MVWNRKGGVWRIEVIRKKKMAKTNWSLKVTTLFVIVFLLLNPQSLFHVIPLNIKTMESQPGLHFLNSKMILGVLLVPLENWWWRSYAVNAHLLICYEYAEGLAYQAFWGKHPEVVYLFTRPSIFPGNALAKKYLFPPFSPSAFFLVFTDIWLWFLSFS